MVCGKSSLMVRKQLDAVEDEGMEQRPVSTAQRWYDKTRIIWIALIAVDLTIQALRTATMSASSARLLSTPHGWQS